MSAPTVAVGMDIGGTKLAAGIVTLRGEASRVVRRDTPADAADLAAAVADVAEHVATTARADGLTVAALGAGSAGVVDQSTGRVAYASSNLPGWTGVALRDVLEQAVGTPATVDNDVNMMAWGDLAARPHAPTPRALYVAVGTGLGGSIAQDGRVQAGTRGTMGEIGHLVVAEDGPMCGCGRRGHLEPLVSGPGIVQRYRRATGEDGVSSLEQLVRRAATDAVARAAIHDAAVLLGRALGGLVVAIDVDEVVIGGGVTAVGELWWEPLTDALQRERGSIHRGELELRPLTTGSCATIAGAGLRALRELAP